MTPLQKAVLVESLRSLKNMHIHKQMHGSRRSDWRRWPDPMCPKCERTTVRMVKAALLAKTIFA